MLKKVAFLKTECHYVDRIPEDQKENYWYTAADYDVAYNNERNLQKCMSANKHIFRKNQESLNSQGLFTDEQVRKKGIAVKTSQISVLREQQKQKAVFLTSRKDGKVVLNDSKVAEAYLSHSQLAMEHALRRAKCIREEVEETPVAPKSPKSPFSPSRFLRKRSKSPKNLVISVASPSVFVAEESSSKMFKITPPAA